MKFAEWAKMYVALAGLVASGVLGVSGLPTVAKLPLAIVVAVAGAFAVWKVENKAEPVEPDAPAEFDPPAPNWRSAGPAWDEPDDPGLRALALAA